MKPYGYSVEGDGIICPQCGDNPMYNLILMEEESVGYPDGYTCADCGTTIKGESNE